MGRLNANPKLPVDTRIRPITRTVLYKAQNIGYIDSFWFATMNFVLMPMLPLLFQVRTPTKGPPPAAVASE